MSTHPEMRVGQGYDRHRLGPDRALLLGGVQVDYSQGLIGHSDADVLLHAVTDALLGATGLGDIGEWFPDTDPQYKNADSRKLLVLTLKEVVQRGWQIQNLDCTIFAEKPKLKAYKPRIRQSLAELLEISEELINVKAKTGEGVDAVGRSEAMEASATVLLMRVGGAGS